MKAATEGAAAQGSTDGAESAPEARQKDPESAAIRREKEHKIEDKEEPTEGSPQVAGAAKPNPAAAEILEEDQRREVEGKVDQPHLLVGPGMPMAPEEGDRSGQRATIETRLVEIVTPTASPRGEAFKAEDQSGKEEAENDAIPEAASDNFILLDEVQCPPQNDELPVEDAKEVNAHLVSGTLPVVAFEDTPSRQLEESAEQLNPLLGELGPPEPGRQPEDA